jgi:hypothetical protein
LIQFAANRIIDSMSKPLASNRGPIHDLPFVIQCHHATLYWLAQAQFEAPFITVRPGQPYGVLVGEDIYGDTLSNARAVLLRQHVQRCGPVVDHGVLAVRDLRYNV